jgi:hypothetical protein
MSSLQRDKRNRGFQGEYGPNPRARTLLRVTIMNNAAKYGAALVTYLVASLAASALGRLATPAARSLRYHDPLYLGRLLPILNEVHRTGSKSLQSKMRFYGFN